MAISGALLTDHEFGVMRVIPMPVHLMTDIGFGSGALLALSPWLFGFAAVCSGRTWPSASWRSAPG